MPRRTAAAHSPGKTTLLSPRVLWAGGALIALVIVGLTVALPRLQPPTGTVLVIGSARSATTIAATTVSIHGSAGWSALGSVSGSVPAAPEQRELLAVPVAEGNYDGVRVGADEQAVAISVVAG
ncbi:MAG: hypothetical protein E6J40_05740, partial [Chloroflexi bacterium]